MKNININFWNGVQKIVISLAMFGLVYVIYCYISGFGVYRAVKYAFLTNEGYDNRIAKYMTKDMFESFNDGYSYRTNDPSKKQLKLYMLFSVNDFFDKGVIWMYYSFKLLDANRNIVAGSTDIPFVLHLKREGRYWKIVQKEEAP